MVRIHSKYRIQLSIIVGCLGYGGMTFLRARLGINHIDGHLFFSLFLFSCILGIMALNPQLWGLLKGVGQRPGGLVWALAVMGMVGICYQIVSVDRAVLAIYKNVHFAYFHGHYILSKSLDILFQQLVLATFILGWWDRGVPLSRIQVISCVTMGLVHVYTLFSLPPVLGSFFILASLAAGYFWPWFFIARSNGIAYTYASHWLFYLVLGMGFNFLVVSG